MAAERKGKKLRRTPKLANMYKLQFGRTDTNKKRRLRTHIRHFPHDEQAVKMYAERYGR